VSALDRRASRSFVLELAGVPAAGKTSTAAALREELSGRGIDSYVVAEAAARSPLKHLKRDWMFNAWTLCQTVADFLEHVEGNAHSVVIFDRGLVDALSWIRWFRLQHQIAEDTWSRLRDFARIPKWFDRTDFVLVLRAHFDTALQRRGRPGQIVNRKTYAELNEAYSATVNEISGGGYNHIRVIDTDDVSVSRVVRAALEVIDNGLHRSGVLNVAPRTR
jgi:thymidylate kinase